MGQIYRTQCMTVLEMLEYTRILRSVMKSTGETMERTPMKRTLKLGLKMSR